MLVVPPGATQACAPSGSPTPAPPTRSCASCDDLAWTNAARFGDASVCSASKQPPIGSCSGLTGFAGGESICESVGARLCTPTELNNDETVGTGCGYDSQLVWTSQTCGAGSHYVTYGRSTAGTAWTCMDDSDSAVVRCCADTESDPVSRVTLASFHVSCMAF